MKSSKFKVQSFKVRRSAIGWSAVSIFVFLLLTAFCSLLTVRRRTKAKIIPPIRKRKPRLPYSDGAKITSVTAERNMQTDAGQFNVQLTRSPSDPRTGETAQFVVRLSEKVEGGFGGGEPAPLENATVTANITKASGANVAENVAAKHEGGNAYRLGLRF